MGEDEAGTARAVRERREAAVEVVRGFGGRLVKTTGDGALLEFPSVVAAVECAILMQKMMAERNAALPEAKRILYRIGVNLGDVLVEGDDIVGDGVNVAARLEGICEPGGLRVSGAVYEHVAGRVAVEFADLGEQSLKNIAKSVRAFALSPESIARAKVETPETEGASAKPQSSSERREPPRLSIIVLPFANIGGDPEQGYFADGVTDSLTTDLSRMSGAFVIARSTAFTFKGRPHDITAIGRELNVRYALEGSVQRRGDRVRVNVQFLDAQTGSHLWAERFDKRLADFFDMQDEIVTRLASQLRVELVRAEARNSTRTPDSLDLVFQGQACLFKGRTPHNLARARTFFEQALALDADNTTALVELALADVTLATAFYSDDRRARLSAAEAAATKALSLSPENPVAHFSLACVFAVTKRAQQALVQCERALEIYPNFANAHALIGFCKAIAGRAEETEAHVQEALRLSPRDVEAFYWLMYVGSAKSVLGCNEEAIVWLRRSIDANRGHPIAHFHLAGALALVGRLEEARAAAAAGLALDPQFTIAGYLAASASDNPGYLAHRARLAAGMRAAGAPEG
jgi:TolB-like protein/Tfp pilus assembly protein PilF